MRALVLPHDGVLPSFGDSVFLAPSCSIIGDVRLGDRVSIWFGVTLRGDVHRIEVGEDSNIQDNSTFHGTLGEWPVILGKRVSVGHAAMIHGAVIEDDVLVGIGARVLDGSRIGRFSLIAAGAVVREGMQVPPRSLVVGVPAQIKRELTDEEVERITRTPERYARLARKTRQACLEAGHDDPFFPTAG